MDARDTEDRARIYDRQFLLSEEKRNQVLELWEVEKYGRDSFADAEYVSVYGMRPAEWHTRGIRLMARTAVECTRDMLGDTIGRDIATLIGQAPPAPGIVVIDPFAGSCNTLYWILRHLSDARGVAFELDERVFQNTRRNLALIDRPIELVHGDYQAELKRHAVPRTHMIVVFVAPPWGDAFDEITGLDLRRTRPPIAEVIDLFHGLYGNSTLLSVVQIHEHLDQRSLSDVKGRFDWSTSKLYAINDAGKNHGILLGARGWTP